VAVAVFETGSAEETEALAARLAAALHAGDVVTVAGELGAGKTTFVRGACRALGVAGLVTSPTFAIGHRYDAPVPVSHLVEWPEHAGAWLPPVRAAVAIAHLDGARREIRIDGDDDLLL
jgi:tRNA threonylcarbamoyladenosine biosynthesis protein TsaE